MKHRTGLWLALVTTCLILLSGCVTLSDPESSQEYRSHVIAEITPGQNFGQVFVSRRPKLNRVQVWLQLPQKTTSQTPILIASLYHKPTDTQPLARIEFSQGDLEKTTPLTIDFPTQVNKPATSFFIQFEVVEGKVIFFGRSENQYAQGEAWNNNEPQVSDAAFRLGYDYNFYDFFSDIYRKPQTIIYILCIFWISWIPGRLYLSITGSDRRFSWGERTALSIGISLAIYPIIFIWTGMLNSVWNQTRVWLLISMMTGIYIYLEIRKNRLAGKFIPQITQDSWISLILLVIFLTSLSIRLVMVRDLSAPAWVDSVHHALLGQLIVQTGEIPGTYAPFVEVETANYHTGFHVVLALFQWLSQLDIAKALLIFGQVINAFMVFSTYLFTMTLVNNRYAGLVAAFVTGLVTPMPAYYTSWGRYTQLAGLVILPAVIAVIYPHLQAFPRQSGGYKTFFKDKDNHIEILLASILLVGLFLTHYRVFAFSLILIFIICSFSLLSWHRNKLFKNYSPHLFYFILSTSFLSLILIIPWLPETVRTLFIPSLVWSQSATTQPFNDFSWNLLTSARGIYSLVIAAMGFLWAIIRKEVFAWILFTWIILLFFLSNLNVWRLPGSNFINNTSVVISLFLPISVFCGYVISWIITGWHHWIPTQFRLYFSAGVLVVSIILGWTTAKPLLTIINPTTLLFRELDRPALSWISENVPAGEPIFINPFAWGYGLYAGSDGGFWISSLSGKPTIPPPVLYGLESPNMRQINLMCSEVIQSNGDPQILYDAMVTNKVNYLYIGAKGGLLSPTKLQLSQKFELIFHNQTTWVFKIK